MNSLSSRYSSLFKASAFAWNLSIDTPMAIVCLCVFSTFLSACGGSSGSDAVSDQQVTNRNDGNPTQIPSTQDSADTREPQTEDKASYNLGTTPQTVIDQCMSDSDKMMLTQVNDARARTRHCGNVNYPATAALSWRCSLENAAYDHSRDMGDHNFFSHTGSDGLAPGDRVRNAGYDWSAAGENIAAGQRSIETVMTAWLDSPGHCVNIMHAAYTELGAASYTVNGSDFPIYWTQLFAKPRN